MKRLIALCFWLLPLLAVAQPYGLQVETNGAVLRPTNFFNANLLATNFVFTATNLAAGDPAFVTETGFTNGVAWFRIGIPAGTNGAIGPAGADGAPGPPATNAIYPTAEFVLTNVNPLIPTGSNYIGAFPQLYRFDLVLPIKQTTGITVPTVANETVVASTNGTAWFELTNDFGIAAIWTNVQIAVVGDSGTNFEGALTLYGLDQPQYYGRTNWLVGQRLFLNDPVNPLDGVNLETMQTAIANATASEFRTVTDADGANHYQFAPFDQTNLDLVLPGTLWATPVGFKTSGTNWQFTVTNVPAAYQLQVSTNLALALGWFSPTNYSVATNLYLATNAWVFTIPKAAIPTSYAFFRVVSFVSPGASFTPPLTLRDLLVLSPRTIASYTNTTYGFGAGAVCVDSNYVYVSVATNRWERAALSQLFVPPSSSGIAWRTNTFTISPTNIFFVATNPVGVPPKFMRWYFRCDHADASTGYQAGDLITFDTADGTVVNTWENSSQIGASFGTPLGDGSAFSLANKTSGFMDSPAWTNFSVVVYWAP